MIRPLIVGTKSGLHREARADYPQRFKSPVGQPASNPALRFLGNSHGYIIQSEQIHGADS